MMRQVHRERHRHQSLAPLTPTSQLTVPALHPVSDCSACVVSSQSFWISLRFNSRFFPGEPRLAGPTGAKDDGCGGDKWIYKTCPVKSPPPTSQHPAFFTGRMPFLSPNQQCQSIERKSECICEIVCIVWGMYATIAACHPLSLCDINTLL